MQIVEFERVEGTPLPDVEAMLEGRIFHVTRRSAWSGIAATGALSPNTDGHLPTTFGSTRSYFRSRGCVSLFDYRAAPNETILEFRRRCWPFQPATPGGEGIAILLLKASIVERLIPWNKWKEENALSEMVVPHVEAGHPGPIPITEVEHVIFLRILENPLSFAGRLRRAREGSGG